MKTISVAQQTEVDQAIEQLIDKTSLVTVLRAIESVCFEKAEHIRDNWQDEDLARQWYGVPQRIEPVEGYCVDRNL